MTSTILLGCTGMVGSHILSTLRSSSPSTISSVDILARRSPPTQQTDIKVNEFIEKDTSKWPSHISSLSPVPSTIFSALATTRGAAGGFENQYKLEHDLNIELAKAAKQTGVKNYILISGGGANASSRMGYVRMKGEIEEHIKELDFERTIILRPGLISGKREESRPAEAVIRAVAAGLGAINTHWFKDGWAQDADVIGRAAIAAALKAEAGEIKDKVWVLGASDIIRLGRTEWKDLK